MLYMFKALGVICDEYFVPSLEVIVEKLQLSNDVAGATFMAAGSSAPELFTSLVATFLIVNEGGVGTIVGSAIFNILVIVGATGWVACKDQALLIWWYPLSRDCFFYSLSITELMVILSNEHVEWYEGLIMFITYCFYCIYMKFNPAIVSKLGLIDPSEAREEGEAISGVKIVEVEAAKPKENQVAPEPVGEQNGNGSLRVAGDAGEDKKAEPDAGAVPAKEGGGEDVTKTNTEVTEVNRMSLDVPAAPTEGKRRPSWSFAETQQKEGQEGEGIPLPLAVDEERQGIWKYLRDPLLVFWELSMPDPERGHGLVLFAASISWIGICTYLMVDAVNRTGTILHIPPLGMALVFLAAGTSIPDALGSIAVAKQGEGDMAVSNALGSNVFDILIGLGIPWTIKAGILQREVSFIGKWDELIYDIVVLVGVLFLFIGCLASNRWYLTRKVGVMLLGCYVMFIIYNILAIWAFDPPLKSQVPVGDCKVI